VPTPAYGFDWDGPFTRHNKGSTQKLDCRSAIIDGEVTVQDRAEASPDYEALKSDNFVGSPQRLVFVACFDFSFSPLETEDSPDDHPLLERRAKLMRA
jgi:ATP-dependent DNA ligase